jgi:hypothetical protein
MTTFARPIVHALGVILCTVMLFGSTAAQASLIEFDFASTCCGLGSTIPGTAPGMPFNISIFADNGGASTVSQTWLDAQYVSATASIGGSVYTLILDQAHFSFNAATNAAGNVTAISLSDFNAGNTDNLGSSSPGLVVNGARNIIFTGNFEADADATTVPSNWTATVVSQVPEPTTLALLSLGLAGLGFRRRKG